MYTFDAYINTQSGKVIHMRGQRDGCKSHVESSKSFITLIVRSERTRHVCLSVCLSVSIRLGIFDSTSEVRDNAFAEWSLIVIPDCTGDSHLGNRSYTYDSGPSI